MPQETMEEGGIAEATLVMTEDGRGVGNHNLKNPKYA
jgi:hypothetical protein